MSTVSVIILTHNEEENIVDCIQSVSFADQVLVIDDFSTDTTLEKAQQLGAKVIQHPMNGDFGGQRNFAIAQADTDWILFLDADERISPQLGREIKAVIEDVDRYAYWIVRENRFHFNKATHGVLRPDWVLRLIPRDGASVEGYVHEAIRSTYPSKRLSGPMYHYTYDNWNQYFNKFNNYTTLSAEKYRDKGKSCSFVKDIILRPMWAFIKMYILEKGFLDGKIGFILSVNHYFYTMTKYVKLYYLNKSNGKL
mgnify:CR=1 FL=1